MSIKLTGENLIAGSRSSLGVDRIASHSAKTNEALEPLFSAATPEEIQTACAKAAEAFESFSLVSGKERADLLDRIAERIGEVSEAAIERAELETALPKPRLTGEVGRTQNQLRMFARLLREGSWVDARIDRGDPGRKPLPKPDVRRMLVPLGPVAVFGASNFPFAFSVAGGDTASALAAGCCVVAKAHPAHAGTCEIIGQAISDAISDCNLPAGIFSLLQGGASVGETLAKDDHLEAIAFTGSFGGGAALMKTAANRPRPIPVFAEMGSTNPVVVLPGVLADETNSVAKDYAASLTLGIGQFCTNPGLLIGIGPAFDELCTQIEEALKQIPAGVMLTEGIRANFERGASHLDEKLGKVEIVRSGDGVVPRIYRVTAARFMADSTLAEEVFGPVGVAIRCESEAELFTLIKSLPGQLTATLHARPSDQDLATRLLAPLGRIAGRLVYNGYPTGVEVCPAMQHGGPYPATSDSRSTSVGTAALLRFVRPVAYQDLPNPMLPPELQDGNPLELVRTVDGVLTTPG
jgi:NADP-dependent aldehyde dehydrogenase